MAKPEVFRRRAEMHQSSSTEEDSRLIARNQATYREAMQEEPQVLLRPEGTFVSLHWCARFLGKGVKEIERRGRLPIVAVDMPGTGVSFSCVRAEDFERTLDSGVLGINVMGKLEVFRLGSLAELGKFERDVIEPTLDQWFISARLEPPQSVAVWSWPGQAAVRDVRSVGELLADHGLEVGFDHYAALVKWVRALPAGDADPTARPAADLVGPLMPEIEVDSDLGVSVPGAPSPFHQDGVDEDDLAPGPARVHARQARRDGERRERQ
jgi:hypothetical protein